MFCYQAFSNAPRMIDQEIAGILYLCTTPNFLKPISREQSGKFGNNGETSTGSTGTYHLQIGYCRTLFLAINKFVVSARVTISSMQCKSNRKAGNGKRASGVVRYSVGK